MSICAWNALWLVGVTVLTFAMFEASTSSQVWCTPIDEPAMARVSKAPIRPHPPRS